MPRKFSSLSNEHPTHMRKKVLTSFSIFRIRTYKYHFNEWDFNKNWASRKFKRGNSEETINLEFSPLRPKIIIPQRKYEAYEEA